MPITVTTGDGVSFFGWGTGITLQSDFIGPLPVGSSWSFQIATDSEMTHPVGEWARTFNTNPIGFAIGTYDIGDWFFGSSQIRDGDTVYWQAILRDNTGAQIDESAGSTTWRDQSGILPTMVSWLQHYGGAGAGLTATQATQLANTDARTSAVLGNEAPTITDHLGAHTFTLGELFTGKALDQLFETELSTGVTGDPVTASIPVWAFGIIIKISTIPVAWQPATPDENWYYPDLAVFRYFRGGDVEQRYSVHTTDVMYIFHDLYSNAFLNGELLYGTPPESSIEVDFAPGVTGQVFLMRMP